MEIVYERETQKQQQQKGMKKTNKNRKMIRAK